MAEPSSVRRSYTMVRRTANREQEPKSEYRRLVPFTDKYIKEIVSPRQGRHSKDLPSREDNVDHLWTSIFTHYFPRKMENFFAVERESYLSEEGQARTDLAVVNLIHEKIHKVVMFEAKRPLAPRDPTPTAKDWNEVINQLRRNMIQTKNAAGAIQDMYGVVAIGGWARFFKMSRHSERLLRIPRETGEYDFDVQKHDDKVEEQLKKWAKEIRKGNSR